MHSLVEFLHVGKGLFDSGLLFRFFEKGERRRLGRIGMRGQIFLLILKTLIVLVLSHILSLMLRLFLTGLVEGNATGGLDHGELFVTVGVFRVGRSKCLATAFASRLLVTLLQVRKTFRFAELVVLRIA